MSTPMTFIPQGERMAQIAGAVRKIADGNPQGLCHPKALVDAARSTRHVCHDLFEWDNDTAGDLYRTDQARRIIRSVRVDFDGGGTQSPAFVHVRVSKGDDGAVNGYMPTERAMGTPDLKAQVLADAIAQLRGMQARYAGLRELSPVWSALDAVDG